VRGCVLGMPHPGHKHLPTVYGTACSSGGSECLCNRLVSPVARAPADFISSQELTKISDSSKERGGPSFEVEAVWARTHGDPEIRVAVLDGPVDTSHPCFRGLSFTAVPPLEPPAVSTGAASRHGTHVASEIFGQIGSPVEGIAPNCHAIFIPVFADGPAGEFLNCTQLDLARAISRAAQEGAHVVNVSGGQPSHSDEPEPLLADVLTDCAKRNILVVAAAGNDGCECLHIPAAAASVLSVGAMDANGDPSPISNWGLAYQQRGILAPGEHIPGAVPGGGIAYHSGTSFAAPIIAGVAGLLLSVQKQLGRSPDPEAVRAALIASALECDATRVDDRRRCLAGRINPRGALALVIGGEPKMPDEIQILRGEAGVAASAELPEAPPAATDPPQQEDGAIADRAPRQNASGMPSEAAAIGQARVAAPAVQGPPGGRSVLPAFAGGLTPYRAGMVRPLMGCECGGGAACTCGAYGPPSLVYALGRIGYDFGTEARRDSFVQAMPEVDNAPGNPSVHAQLISYLSANLHEAENLIWTLNLDVTPIYAICPVGPYATNVYERLRQWLEAQNAAANYLVSVPGVISGSARLASGQVVPVIVPAIRGMYSWTPEALIAAQTPAPTAEEATGLADFLNRVYYAHRNLGVTPEDRALNFSATNAFQATQVIRSVTRENLDLDTITVSKSPVCRPDSDCYDVEIGFFDPTNLQVARTVARFTVDVSDVIPVTLGAPRFWRAR
jgi:cyanobactin maturation PatA/PatG family protease